MENGKYVSEQDLDNPFHPDFSVVVAWERMAIADPERLWALRRECITEDIEVMKKRAKTRENIRTMKVLEKMLAETNMVLETLKQNVCPWPAGEEF